MFCVRGKLIQAELFKNGYQTFNKDIKCWKISETANSLSVSPSDQWFFAVVLTFGKIKDFCRYCVCCYFASCCMQFLSVFAVVLAFDEIKDYLSLYLYAVSLAL